MVAAEPDSQITFLDFNQKSESQYKQWTRKLRQVFKQKQAAACINEDKIEN